MLISAELKSLVWWLVERDVDWKTFISITFYPWHSQFRRLPLNVWLNTMVFSEINSLMHSFHSLFHLTFEIWKLLGWLEYFIIAVSSLKVMKCSAEHSLILRRTFACVNLTFSFDKCHILNSPVSMAWLVTRHRHFNMCTGMSRLLESTNVEVLLQHHGNKLKTFASPSTSTVDCSVCSLPREEWH